MEKFSFQFSVFTGSFVEQIRRKIIFIFLEISERNENVEDGHLTVKCASFFCL